MPPQLLFMMVSLVSAWQYGDPWQLLYPNNWQLQRLLYPWDLSNPWHFGYHSYYYYYPRPVISQTPVDYNAVGNQVVKPISLPPGLTLAHLKDIADNLEPLLGPEGINDIIRLVFHDCIGGCDGCVNLAQIDNNGLANVVDRLEEVYTSNSFNTIISRADLWAYAAQLAVNRAIANNNAFCLSSTCKVPESGLEFLQGRKDCPTSPATTINTIHPKAFFNFSDVMAFFSSNFNMTERESVALMGAHNSGKATLANSGYSGHWVRGEAGKLSNQYYRMLVNNQDWIQVDATAENRTVGPHFQWVSKGKGMMLNTDMTLYKDIMVDPLGKSSCNFSNCQHAKTAKIVLTYAASNSDWMKDFSRVFAKMLAQGTHKLSTVN